MNYSDALGWLSERSTIDFNHGVARVKWILSQLGNPEESIASVHVVGTNGKGSTVNALSAVFKAAGYRVGRFTSPSILDYREQIVYQDQMISEADFAEIVTSLKPLVERLSRETTYGKASEFEVLVVLMFVYFADYCRAHILLIEAGMGGLLDATNVLTPVLVLCPSIGLDHQVFLGESYQEIAAHKVAVLREGIPFVYASNHKEVQAVFEEQAARLGSQTYALGRDFYVKGQSDEFGFTSPFGSYSHLHLAMVGLHQVRNAALVIMALQLLRKNFPNLDETAIRQGLAVAKWPGRLEFIRENVLVDGAHNNESIAALCNFLKEKFPNKKISLLFAAIHMKPVKEMLAQLEELADITVTTFGDERALSLDDYPLEYTRVASVKEWLERRDWRDLSVLYVITGSLYFIREVRGHLNNLI